MAVTFEVPTLNLLVVKKRREATAPSPAENKNPSFDHLEPGEHLTSCVCGGGGEGGGGRRGYRGGGGGGVGLRVERAKRMETINLKVATLHCVHPLLCFASFFFRFFSSVLFEGEEVDGSKPPCQRC